MPASIDDLLAIPLSCSETALGDGRVLLAGGPGVDWASAELFDPEDGAFRRTGLMTAGRASHAAALLADGRVLIAGGTDEEGNSIATTEVFDPATGQFLPGGVLDQPRANATATLLADGRVLITGGDQGRANAYRALDTAEVFDPVTGRSKGLAGRMVHRRRAHAAVRLLDGKVLLAGGQEQQTDVAGELFDPASGRFTVTGAPSVRPRSQASLILMADGRVLFDDARNPMLVGAEVYDPATGLFTSAWCPSSSSPTQREPGTPSPVALGNRANARKGRNHSRREAGCEPQPKANPAVLATILVALLGLIRFL